MKSRPRPLFVSVITALFLALPAVGRDASTETDKADASQRDLYALDLKSLLDLKVTTASKFSEKLSDAPGVMSVVTRDELKRFGGLTLREILERVPGLAGTVASFTDRSIIAARGDQTKVNGGHVLFLINGRPTREVLEGGLIGDLLESFPVNVLEKIEVIRGPGSVLYGSNAFSAVVNLITQRADGNKLVVTGLGAQGAGAATSGQVMFQRGDLSVVGAGQFRQTPNWVTPCWSAFGGTQTITIPNRGKGAYVGMNYKGWSLMTSFTDWKTSYVEGMVGEGWWRRGFADLGYNLKASKNWDMSFNLTYTRTALNAESAIPFITRDSSEIVVEWTNVVQLTDKDRLTFGTLYNHIHGMENFFFAGSRMTIADGSRPGEAFYGQIDHELLENVKLIGGFQANKIGRLDLDIVPRAGLIWSPAPRFSVKGLYSEAFRAPSLNETLLQYIPPPAIGGPSLLGSSNLAPEKVATFDIGVSYQGNRFQAGVDYFHSQQTDNIILADVTTNGHYMNSGETTFQGVELEGKYYLRKSLFLTGSTIYQTNQDESGNRNVTPIANWGAKAGLSYASASGLTASLFDVYQGPLDGYSNSINPRPGAYHLLNLHVRYDLARHLPVNYRTGVALLAHADNLTNQPLWLPDWKDSPGNSIFAHRGRTVYFGIEVSFGKE